MRRARENHTPLTTRGRNGFRRERQNPRLKSELLFNSCENSKQIAEIVPQSIQDSVAPVSESVTLFRLKFCDPAQSHAKP